MRSDNNVYRTKRMASTIAPVLAVLCCLGPVATLFAENRTAGPVHFSKRCLLVNANEGCDIADVNRDGRPDIIAGTHWFPSPDFVPHLLRDIEARGEYLNNSADLAYDVDGDGWVDVVAGGYFGPHVHWYKNPGQPGLEKGWKWKEHLLRDLSSDGIGNKETMALNDFDGDGKPELFVSLWSPKLPVIAWKIETAGKELPSLKGHKIGEQGGGHGYGFGDVNGDGRQDVVTTRGWYEQPAGDPWAGPWKLHPETAIPFGASCPFLVVDLTGNGRGDLILSKAHSYGIYWWEQGEPKADGTTAWTEHLIDDSWSQAHCLAWADLDGDGLGELITGKRVRPHNGKDPGGTEPECLYYYIWDRTGRKFVRHTISPPGGGVGSGMHIRVADLNDNGRLDIVVAGKTGTWLLLNEGARSGQ